TRIADQTNYRFIDALRMEGQGGSALDPADSAAVLAKAVSLLGTPYPVDQLALFGAIMAVRGKWPVHPWGRLLARVALDHALPDSTDRMVCSEVVYRAYAECAATPAGRLAPVIVIGERGTAPFPDIDWKALFDEIWPLLHPQGRESLQPARMRLNTLRSGELHALHEDLVADAQASVEELERARHAALERAGVLAVVTQGGHQGRVDGDDTVAPDANPGLVEAKDLAISASLARRGRLI